MYHTEYGVPTLHLTKESQNLWITYMLAHVLLKHAQVVGLVAIYQLHIGLLIVLSVVQAELGNVDNVSQVMLGGNTATRSDHST